MNDKPKREFVPNVTAPHECPACGGTEFERGMVMNGGYQELKNDEIPFFSNPKKLVAFRCLNCNHVEFYVDENLIPYQRFQQIVGILLVAMLLGIFAIGFMVYISMR